MCDNLILISVHCERKRERLLCCSSTSFQSFETKSSCLNAGCSSSFHQRKKESLDKSVSRAALKVFGLICGWMPTRKPSAVLYNRLHFNLSFFYGFTLLNRDTKISLCIKNTSIFVENQIPSHSFPLSHPQGVHDKWNEIICVVSSLTSSQTTSPLLKKTKQTCMPCASLVIPGIRGTEESMLFLIVLAR